MSLSKPAITLKQNNSIRDLLRPYLKAHPPLTFEKHVKISSCSKEIKKGDIFFSFSHPDQHRFIQEALDKQASIVIVDKDTVLSSTERVCCVPDARLMYAKCLSILYDHTQPPYIYAITGTNGKTSTAYFLYQLLIKKGVKAAYLGTTGFVCHDGHFTPQTPLPALTSPGAEVMHALCLELYNHGFDSLVVEASSHGLDQKRLHGLTLTSGAFLNLTQDHLDYHTTMKDYFRAKKRLFDDFDLKDGGVINYDDPWARKLMHYPHTHTFGTHSDADFCLKKITPTTQGTSLTLRIHAKMYDISWPVLGTFQALNLLAALAMLSRRFCVEDLMRHVPHLQSPPGRMELYLYEHKKIVIDFAHTPDALEKALLEVKKIAATDADASVWVIFGCGGNRDKEKRALMGAVADRLADHIVLTNDNPRYEHPESIVYDIQKGIKKNTPHILLDRKKAISFVISHMGPKDCLLIAGKGHETTQIIQGTAYDLSDRQIVADWVQQKTE